MAKIASRCWQIFAAVIVAVATAAAQEHQEETILNEVLDCVRMQSVYLSKDLATPAGDVADTALFECNEKIVAASKKIAALKGDAAAAPFIQKEWLIALKKIALRDVLNARAGKYGK